MLRSGWVCARCSRQQLSSSVSHGRLYASTNAASGVPAKLLARARQAAEEHAQLSAQLEKQYDAQSAKRAGDLSKTADLLREVERLKEAMTELNAILRDEKSSDAELRALASDDIESTSVSLARAAAALTSSLVPKHPFEHLPCLIEIRPGAGGSEAALFAGDLVRMYQAYCANHNLPCNILKYEDTNGMGNPNDHDAPLQEAILEVSADGAYGVLRSEAGVHRVQRVPATESKGRTHTSAASVLVLPSFPENQVGEEDNSSPDCDSYIDAKEVRQEVMRARGAGGQHVNKTESAVRLTHIPSGTVVSIQDSRSQVANRDKAWKLLRSKIALARREAREEEMVKMRRSAVGVARVGRGDKVRTYNWGQQRITDHRSGFTTHGLHDALGGGPSLEQVMESVRQWMAEQEVELLLIPEGENSSK